MARSRSKSPRTRSKSPAKRRTRSKSKQRSRSKSPSKAAVKKVQMEIKKLKTAQQKCVTVLQQGLKKPRKRSRSGSRRRY
jgi:hypothetical protein